VKPFPLMGPDDTYDAEKYQEMLFKATEEILIHFGYDWRDLGKMINPSPDCLPKPRRRRGRSTRQE